MGRWVFLLEAMNKGWERDHLDNNGLYVGPALVPMPHDAGEDETY